MTAGRVRSFDDEVEDALAAGFAGWDFSWLRRHSVVEPLPWSYHREVVSRASGVPMLDMGTGGGEVLAGLDPPAASVVATEAWPPNVPIAAYRLRSRGVAVVHDEGASENVHGIPERGRLPFRDRAFGLVANRHEAFDAREVARVLAESGWFVTQQVDHHSYDDFRAVLGLEPTTEPESWLPEARAQVEASGLRVEVAGTGEEPTRFTDISGIVYYLIHVPWVVPEFDLVQHEPALRALHDRLAATPLVVRQRRFLLVARR